jgi:hypothetical protein
MRRFMGHMLPKCFGSTEAGSSYELYHRNEQYNGSYKVSNGGPIKSRDRPGMGGSSILRTVNTKVEHRSIEDDEVKLVVARARVPN